MFPSCLQCKTVLLGTLMLSLTGLTACSQLTGQQAPAPVTTSHTGHQTQPGGGGERADQVSYDLRPLAVRMADAMLASPVSSALKKTPDTVMLVAPLAERDDGIDTLALTEAMASRLAANGVHLADAEQVAAIRQQLEYRSADGSPVTAALVRLGKQSSATHLFYGHLSPASGQSGSRFRLDMSLMELKSGELLWHKQLTMTRQQARKTHR